jgi:hypothetical protein
MKRNSVIQMITNLHFVFVLLVQSIIFCSCKKEPGKSSGPDISAGNSIITVVEDTPSASVSVPVTLSAAPDKTVSLEYSTSDSTAIAGKDYTGVNLEKLTFQPGETSKVIKINILPDTAQKHDVYFKIVFSNPSNGVLVKSDLIIKIINVDYATLTWSDEFNASPLNTATWNYELGAGGWGNNELENYTSSVNNVHIDSGYLHISALNPSGSSYTSGRITTQGKKQFTYFRVEMLAKLPEGKGIWPALWMLGSNISTVGWPKCGEIDIMELIGNQPSTVHGTLHWDENGHVSRSNSFSLYSGRFSSGFHKFTLVWTPNRLVWYVDNQQFSYLSRGEVGTFPFDLPQFFIFNVAVGGNWPGSPDQTTVFPQHMIVDYIRVYQ